MTQSPNTSAWEQAYLRFETPEQERRKFVARLRRLGADEWRREAAVVELFCGRGNGLAALASMGFANLQGVDLSPALAGQYGGPGRVHVADCRALPFADAAFDVAIVQGGLHHLPSLDDLEKTLDEARRILRPGGRFVAVEPWLTPFLRVAHWLSERRIVRRCSVKFDALQTMIEHERQTYERWLSQPREILSALRARFSPESGKIAWGKLMFVGRPI